MQQHTSESAKGQNAANSSNPTSRAVRSSILSLAKNLRKTKLGPQSPIRKYRMIRNSPRISPQSAPVNIDPLLGGMQRNSKVIRPFRQCSARGLSKEIDQSLQRDILACKESLVQLRNTILALTGKMNFAIFDSLSDAQGEIVLEPLREALEMLYQHSCAFQHLLGMEASVPDITSFLLADDTDVFGCRKSSDVLDCAGPGNGVSNEMRVKTTLVSLRGFMDRLPTDISAKSANRVAAMLSQGLMEQILSWASEADSCFDACRQFVLDRKRKVAAQFNQEKPKFYRHSTKPLSIPAHRGDRSENQVASTVRNFRSEEIPRRRPPIKISAKKLEAALDRLSRHRMEQHRPRRLLIPEASLEESSGREEDKRIDFSLESMKP